MNRLSDKDGCSGKVYTALTALYRHAEHGFFTTELEISVRPYLKYLLSPWYDFITVSLRVMAQLGVLTGQYVLI